MSYAWALILGWSRPRVCLEAGCRNALVVLDSAVRLAERPSTSRVNLLLSRQYESSCFLRTACYERLLPGFFEVGPTYLWLQVLEERNVLQMTPW